LVVGSSSHVGPQLVDAVRGTQRVTVMTDDSPAGCGAPVHPNIAWLELDIADADELARALEEAGADGDFEGVVFLAAEAGSGSEGEARYRRINVDGLRNVVAALRQINPATLIYARTAPRGEDPNGDTAERVRIDEETERLLAEARKVVPTHAVGLAARPRILVTGASGFIGRHLLETIKDDYQVFAMARSSQSGCGAPVDPNITWFQVDLSDRRAVEAVFRRVRESGGVDLVVHLAAYYDFVSKDHPEYWRTNVDGLRTVLDECRKSPPRCFIFASSIAACEFPPRGRVLDETSPPDGKHVYAATKRIGEAMLDEYRDAFPSVIVRFAALFSDWCEYPPVFVLMNRWCSSAWDRRVLGGRGGFAVPYLHVRESQVMLRRILALAGDLDPGEVLLASTDGAIPLRELFEMTTRYLNGEPERPLVLPRPVCRLGMHLRDWSGTVFGERPFERPWMARYIDRELPVVARRTRERLGWSPRERLGLLRRLPFLVENYRRDPTEWNRRNYAAMEKLRNTLHLKIHWLLERHQAAIEKELEAMLVRDAAGANRPAGVIPDRERRWERRRALQQLMSAIRTRDMSAFSDYCRRIADRRFDAGYLPEEADRVLAALRDSCLAVLRGDPEAAPILGPVEDQIGMTTLFGRDQIEERYEELHGGAALR
jgi:nucleoside-diphosphate-sugar epimerase